RSAPLPSITGRDVTSHPEFVIALDSEHVQFIEWELAKGLASANLMVDFIIIALRFWKPMQSKGALQFLERMLPLRPQPPGLGRDRAVESEPLFGEPPKRDIQLRQLF